MSWLTNLWNGMSPCMTPGVERCVVWWEAWAAVGSFLAVATALGIGAAPILFRRRQARAIALIVRVKVDHQLLHVGASLLLVDGPSHTGMEDNSAKINIENCDPATVRELLPYFDILPAALSNALSLYIVDLETVQRLLSMRSFRERGTTVLGSTMSGMLSDLEGSVSKARKELLRYTRAENTDITAEYQKMAAGLKRLAALADGDPRKDEAWLRRHILGMR